MKGAINNMLNDKIVKIETFRWTGLTHILWVEITTANGLVGLGETYYIPGAVESVIHDMAAPLLMGKNPFNIEDHWISLFACANFFGYAGAEMRAFSAIDIALWDILGQASGLPIYNLLGGKCRDRIPVYNTCINSSVYMDSDNFWDRPGELAQELLERGIRGMKVWPWDRFAPQIKSKEFVGPSGWSAMGPVGHLLSLEDLKKGLRVVEEIRKAVGTKMEIMIEGHSRWDLNCALKIARALEEHQPFWMEDMIQPDSADDLARLALESRVPHAVSERLFTKYAYRNVLEKKAAHVVMLDIVWTGGITESKKIATMADAYHLSVAPHDCTGPITVFASLHLCANASNVLIMETVRGFYEGYYKDVITNPLVVKDGYIEFSDLPGLGTALQLQFKLRSDVYSRVTK